MLKWKVHGTYNNLYVQRAFSNLDSSKFKNVSPTLEEKQSLLSVTFFQKKNEFNRNETHTTSAPQPTSNSEIIDRLNSISSDVENLKQLFYDFAKRVMANLELFKNTFI
ncbi:alpha-soluble NSF attachment protein 2, partial [Striga asiatica]